jgi:hypothetical protein
VELRRAALFSRPTLTAAAIRDVPVISAQGLVAAVNAEAERVHATIGGRIALAPYWKCWSSTPTMRASGRSLQ